MKKKLVILCIAAAMSVSMLGGCGNSAKTTDSTKTEDTTKDSDQDRWSKMAMLNTACSGKFTSDRTIEEYVKDIWKLKKVTVPSGQPE